MLWYAGCAGVMLGLTEGGGCWVVRDGAQSKMFVGLGEVAQTACASNTRGQQTMAIGLPPDSFLCVFMWPCLLMSMCRCPYCSPCPAGRSPRPVSSTALAVAAAAAAVQQGSSLHQHHTACTDTRPGRCRCCCRPAAPTSQSRRVSDCCCFWQHKQHQQQQQWT
jgi:hypothetical protein